MARVGRLPSATLLAAGLLALLPLAACASTPEECLEHRVEVSERQNDFLQTRSKIAWSYQTLRDAHGHRWPTGRTVSARAEQSMVDGRRSHWVEFRDDSLLPGADLDAAFVKARERKGELTGACTFIELKIDGRSQALPVTHLHVAAYGDRARMPIPPTDVEGHPVEHLVARLPPERVVLSTQVRVQPDAAQFEQLVSAQAVDYAWCGMTGRLRLEERDGLRQVYEWLD